MLSTKNLLRRLAELDEQTASILTTALSSGDLRLALAAIREARAMITTYARVSPISRSETQAWEAENERRGWLTMPAPEQPSHRHQQQPPSSPPQRPQPPQAPLRRDPFSSNDPDLDHLLGVDEIPDDALARLFDEPTAASHPPRWR
jgi:hypothetical protein